MPNQPQWLSRVPRIIQELEKLSAPLVDRVAFEKVFQVKRRRAVQLMHEFNGYQVGRAFVIERDSLLARLRVYRSDDLRREQGRRDRVTDELESARKMAPGRAVVIPVGPESRDTKMSGLSSAVKLGPGRLVVEFGSTEDLLRSLWELSQAILNDYDRFEERIRGVA